jgi:3-hydroxybutyryl-CoA dehydrogenase
MAARRVGIVGTGIMGSGIAELAASKGHSVVVWGRSQASVDRCLSSIDKSLTRLVEKQKLSVEQAESIKKAVSATTDMADLAECEVVLETVVEDVDVKRDVIFRIDSVAGPDALLATNTSTLPVTELSRSAPRHPGRFVGLHFSNPPQVMPLIEVVEPVGASEEAVELAVAFARDLGKEPIRVKDRAGFVLNGLLFPYLNNAIRMLEEGIATKEDIDAAMRNGAGFPMGPFQVLDLVGLDTSLSILETLYDEYGDPNFKPRPLLRRLVAAGHLGRKSGRGFYEYR